MNPQIEFETVLPGIATEYECREACIFSGYTWKEWRGLDWYERAATVAHYRVHYLIEAHVQDAVRVNSERKSRRAKH